MGEGGVIVRTARRARSARTSSARSSTCTSCTTCSSSGAGTRLRRRWSSRRRTCRCARARHLLGRVREGDRRRPGQHHRLESFFNRTAPELLERLEFYEDKDEPLFEKYGVEDAFQSVLKRRVDLPSGGYLMIDYAEAMTVIDVNSGSFTGRGKGAKLEDTITRTNLEAAEEVVRQLRLRDIGGIIVIDFIDMARAQPRHGPEDAAQVARRGPHEDLRGRDLAARARGDDAPERPTACARS